MWRTRGPVRDIVARLASFDIAIFVSPTAAARAMAHIGSGDVLPRGLLLAAVGPGTARELRRHTAAPVLVPARRFDSEGLLELPELAAVAGRRVVIFRGEGGRELLGEELSARGARVEYAECYRRRPSDADVTPLIAAWSRGQLDALVVTSSEGLGILYEKVGEAGRGYLRESPVFVPHPSIARAGRELGLGRIIEAASGDEAMLGALCRYFAAADSRGDVQ
jgi:uroporphyrinogen-III synthase